MPQKKKFIDGNARRMFFHYKNVKGMSEQEIREKHPELFVDSKVFQVNDDVEKAYQLLNKVFLSAIEEKNVEVITFLKTKLSTEEIKFLGRVNK